MMYTKHFARDTGEKKKRKKAALYRFLLELRALRVFRAEVAGNDKIWRNYGAGGCLEPVTSSLATVSLMRRRLGGDLEECVIESADCHRCKHRELAARLGMTKRDYGFNAVEYIK